MAVAILPARRGYRDPGLDPDAPVERAARPLARPALRGDRRRIITDHRGKRVAIATLERRSEIRLDLAHDSDAAVDHTGIELQQRRASLNLGNCGRAGVDAAGTDQWKRAFRAHEGFRQHPR